eukprot:TRINITY_DN9630_c0_g1_i3.p1 TRINITY_DN9630_c0_g1~~TRINITY_DN9630_c0_g1_i3.p1  ORF type:complete len:691 (-),score=166.44 TRINITY_DN9630_c0_g1_i3:160-2232(-)
MSYGSLQNNARPPALFGDALHSVSDFGHSMAQKVGLEDQDVEGNDDRLMAEFEQMDRGHHHEVTRREWVTVHGDDEGFDEYDEDGDGKISEIEYLKLKMEKICQEDHTLAVFAEELHSLPADAHELRKLYNLWLEPLKVNNANLRFYGTLDKILSLSIMVLGTLVPMLHLMGFKPMTSALVGGCVPLLQGINMNFQPHKRAMEHERIRDACMSEGHHFFSLTGEYHGEDHNSEVKHFLASIEAHRTKKGKPKKKEGAEGEGAEGEGAASESANGTKDGKTGDNGTKNGKAGDNGKDGKSSTVADEKSGDPKAATVPAGGAALDLGVEHTRTPSAAAEGAPGRSSVPMSTFEVSTGPSGRSVSRTSFGSPGTSLRAPGGSLGVTSLAAANFEPARGRLSVGSHGSRGAVRSGEMVSTGSSTRFSDQQRQSAEHGDQLMRAEIADLEAELEGAAAAQDFEACAEIRDELKSRQVRLVASEAERAILNQATAGNAECAQVEADIDRTGLLLDDAMEMQDFEMCQMLKARMEQQQHRLAVAKRRALTGLLETDHAPGVSPQKMDPQLQTELKRINDQTRLTKLMIRKAAGCRDFERCEKLRKELQEQTADYEFCLKLGEQQNTEPKNRENSGGVYRGMRSQFDTKEPEAEVRPWPTHREVNHRILEIQQAILQTPKRAAAATCLLYTSPSPRDS